MKKSELRQLIREEISKVLKENESGTIFHFDKDDVNIEAESGDYYGYDEGGKITFLLILDGKTEEEMEFMGEDEAFKEYAPPIFKEILGKIGGEKVALGDEISITVDYNKLKQTYKAKNSYVKKDEEGWFLDSEEITNYLNQFDSEGVNVDLFMGDDYGFGGEDMMLGDVENMTDEEIEQAARQAMSYYFFSNPDSI